MTTDDEAEIAAKMRAARARSRGYASFFGWATDRDLEEWGVVVALDESLCLNSAQFFTALRTRGRPNDPPDCEAQDFEGKRIALEVTELVDGDAIHAFKSGRHYDWAEWPREKFISVLTSRLIAKDHRFPELKGAPYEGGYIVVVHTDEPELPRSTVERYLSGHKFEGVVHINRAFLLLSYDPEIKRCPYYELAIGAG